MVQRWGVRAVLVFVVCGAAVLAAAQQPVVVPEQPNLRASSPEEQLLLHQSLVAEGETYGTQDPSIYQIPWAALEPIGTSAYLIIEASFYVRLPSSLEIAVAPVNLPNGVQVNWLDLWYYDSSGMGDAEAKLYRSCGDDPPSTAVLATVNSSGGGGGYGYGAQSLSTTITNDCQYWVQVTGLSQDSALQFRRIKAVDLWYKNQISPAPATATFSDVPVGAFGFQHVEALSASGITAGCGGGNFCPDAPLTRVQMAVFLSKALGLHWPY